MDVLTKAKLKLAKMMNVKFGSITAEDGTVFQFDGDEFTDGEAVYILNVDGILSQPEAGDYPIGDGKVLEVDGNGIGRLKDAEGSGSSEDENMEVEEATEAISDVDVTDFNDLVEVVNDIVQEVNKQEEKIAELEEELDTVTAEYAKTKEEFAAYKARFEKAIKPNGKPIINHANSQPQGCKPSGDIAGRFFNGWKDKK